MLLVFTFESETVASKILEWGIHLVVEMRRGDFMWGRESHKARRGMEKMSSLEGRQFVSL